jgi:peptidoglycan/LPS O-acetylase OafA/YrhL
MSERRKSGHDSVVKPQAGVPRGNNFDALRIAAALTVLVGHAFTLTGTGSVPRVGDLPLHSLGVGIFFAISGYLIARSWRRNPDLFRFFRHRVLRIFPALVVVVVLTVFVVGPLFTTRGLNRYFSDPETYEYLQTATLLARYTLPGVFEGTAHHSNAVNGSLWTLGVEFGCYVGVVLVAMVFRGRFGWKPFLALGLAGAALSVLARAGILPALSGAASAIELVVYFCIGSVLAFSRQPPNAYLAGGLVALWACVGVWIPSLGLPLSWVAVPVGIVFVGTRSWGGVRRASRWGDPSYGLYAWAYLVQQAVISLRPGLDLATNIAIVAALSLALGYASWHLVEKPALAKKDRPLFRRSNEEPDRQAVSAR